MLSRFVRFSTAAGMDNSISTNATASSETLGGLVDAGMSRFHVSLDTADEARFDYLTRTRGLLSRVRESLRTLCSLRDSGRRVAVVVNTVLGPDRIRDTLRDGGRDLGMLLDWLKQARVDDFKFVLDSSEDEPSTTRDELSAFYRLFDGIVPREFPMFHLRMQTLFDGGHGFRDDRPRHCFQCLDDRVTDSRAAYPCIARLREGGSPVFELDDPDEVKSSRLAAFLASDRSRDPLCRRCCFDLYRDMNERVAWLLENGPCSGN
jgi:MoaA/NifB/PqqE/SkfB family radical SAM enzyme